MTKKLYLPFLMAMVVALMTSCSKKMGELSSDYFTVTPQVLEAVGGKVPATINGKFPEKYFNKKAVVEVTPVLKWNGGEAKGQSAVFQGEKVEGNDQTISYKMGGSYTMKTSFDYVPEMAKSELYLEFKATVGKKTVTIPAVKVADGVISTSEMLEQTLGSANPANGDDAFQRIIKEKHDANIMFLIQQANVRASELKTAKEFGKEVKNIDEAENKKISNIEISAYASPDGGVGLNTTLAENRQDNTAKIIGKSDEEIANLADSDAKQLNIEELLYATTLTKDAAKQEAIFTKATQIYPNDFRAYNNLGKLAYQAGDLDKAESYFKKALSIKDAPEANMNLGLIALTKGDRTAAESYLSKASGSKELNEALGNLYVAQGQYDKAVSSFGDTKTNSAALAQILAKDYNKAKNTLAAIERPDAYTDYLMAVLGERTNNTSMVTSSLKNAIAKEPALAKKAASDLEFAKYFTNTDFMNIIK